MIIRGAKLTVLSCLLLFLVLASSAYGIKISACIGGAGGSVSASGSYDLDASTSLNLDATLGQGAIYQERHATGSGENCIKETVSGKQYSIGNTIASSGMISSSSNAAAFNDAGTVGASTSISGESGFIGITSSSEKNTVSVAGGFSDDGYLQSDLTSIATDRASTVGTASMLGVECYDGNMAQYLNSGEAAVSVQGIHQTADGNLGDFGMLAANSEHSGRAAGKTVAKAAAVDESKGYLLTGWRLASDAGIQMQLASKTIPSSIGGQNAATAVATEICTAANTWDAQTHEILFLGDDSNNIPGTGAAVTTATYNPLYSRRSIRDYKNIEAWTTGFGKSSKIIAMTVTWYNRNPTIAGDDGNTYKQALESDCWYNSYMPWRIATDTNKGAFDVQTIALHELGHTLGLADLYASLNSDRVMYGYNDGSVKRTLTTEDTTGLQTLYGPQPQ